MVRGSLVVQKIEGITVKTPERCTVQRMMEADASSSEEEGVVRREVEASKFVGSETKP